MIPGWQLRTTHPSFVRDGGRDQSSYPAEIVKISMSKNTKRVKSMLASLKRLSSDVVLTGQKPFEPQKPTRPGTSRKRASSYIRLCRNSRDLQRHDRLLATGDFETPAIPLAKADRPPTHQPRPITMMPYPPGPRERSTLRGSGVTCRPFCHCMSRGSLKEGDAGERGELSHPRPHRNSSGEGCAMCTLHV